MNIKGWPEKRVANFGGEKPYELGKVVGANEMLDECAKAVEGISRQLRLSNDALKENLEQCGSCDHTVNQCVCELVHLIEDNDNAIKYLKVESSRPSAPCPHGIIPQECCPKCVEATTGGKVVTDNDISGLILGMERRLLQKCNHGFRGEERGYFHAMIRQFMAKFTPGPVGSKEINPSRGDYETLDHHYKEAASGGLTPLDEESVISTLKMEWNAYEMNRTSTPPGYKDMAKAICEKFGRTDGDRIKEWDKVIMVSKILKTCYKKGTPISSHTADDIFELLTKGEAGT